MKDACINWQDGNSLKFEDKIYQEKKENELLIQNLREKKDIVKFIYNKYKDFGKKIECNLANKENLMMFIDDCQNQVDNILKDFNNIDTDFYFSQKHLILEEKSKMLNIKKELSEIKNSVRDTYNKIEKIEKEIQQKIDKISEIKINEFEFEIS